MLEPKFTSHSDPASLWAAARKGKVFFAYSTNYLIDTDHAVIIDVETTRSIRQAEVGSACTMLDRVKGTFDLDPECIIADTAAQITVNSHLEQRQITMVLGQFQPDTDRPNVLGLQWLFLNRAARK